MRVLEPLNEPADPVGVERDIGRLLGYKEDDIESYIQVGGITVVDGGDQAPYLKPLQLRRTVGKYHFTRTRQKANGAFCLGVWA